MERGESAWQSYFGGNWVALPDERAHDMALRLARTHPVIASEAVSIPMKPCSSNYARISKHQKVATNCVSEWRLSIHSRISVDGKGDVPGMRAAQNLFYLRRCAVVHNLHVLARSQSLQADLQDAA
jgi:hypothetical protein